MKDCWLEPQASSDTGADSLYILRVMFITSESVGPLNDRPKFPFSDHMKLPISVNRFLLGCARAASWLLVDGESSEAPAMCRHAAEDRCAAVSGWMK